MKRGDRSIGERLARGFGAILGLVVLQLAISLVLLYDVDQLDRQLAKVVRPRVRQASALQTAFMGAAINVRTYAMTGTPEYLARFRQSARDADAAVRALDELPQDPDDALALDAIRPLARRYAQGVEAFIMLAQSRPPLAAIRDAEVKLGVTRAELLDRVQEYVSLQQRKEAALRGSVESARTAMRWAIILLAVGTVALGVVVAVHTTSSVRRPAERLAVAARALERGDYAPAAALAPGMGSAGAASRDELLVLSASFASMAQALQRREERLAADARLGSALAASVDVGTLAGEALDAAIRFAGCEMGAAYLLSRDGASLERIASRADTPSPPSLPAGEGVPGQAVADGRTLVVRDIPPDTPFRLRFGVDEVPPRTIIVAPIVFQGRTMGALLLAGIHDVTPDAVEFTEHAAVQLGVSLQNALAHRDVARLAADLQSKNEELEAQNEELQAQSEEIQAQNEELQSMSEEVQAQNEELQAQSEEIQAQNEELAQSARQKDEFLAMLGHELRNPLAAIANASRLLDHAAGEDEAAIHFREVIGRQTENLARLVEDLLDVSRITHGLVELRQEDLDLREVVRRAADATRGMLDARHHDLCLSLPPEPLWVHADPTRLEQVFTNLLTNAAKYTEPEGRITVTVGAEVNNAMVRVRDNGIGIAPEMLPRIFDAFTQGERPLNRPEGGLGLGLTMVRRLVEMHGGSVEAHSAGLHQGSEFIVRLPKAGAGRPAQEPRAAAPARPGAACRVLIVDDNADSADTLGALIEIWGHQVRIARDGREAIAAARECPPDVILMDLGLPGMDGYEVARRLREEGLLRDAMLVAVTGYGEDEHVRRTQAAGFHQHLTKPVNTHALEQMLAQAARVTP